MQVNAIDPLVVNWVHFTDKFDLRGVVHHRPTTLCWIAQAGSEAARRRVCKEFPFDEMNQMQRLPGFLGSGASFCHPRDQFDRQVGRKRSLARAMEAAELCRDERTKIWHAYDREIGLVKRGKK